MNEIDKDTAVEGQLMDPITVLRTERRYLDLEELHVPGWVEVIIKTTGGYEWDFFGAWYDSDARIFYWHRDSGCSCTSPGDSVYTIGDLECGRADELTYAYKDWASEEYNDALTNAEKVSAAHDIKAAIKTALARAAGDRDDRR